MNEESKMEAPKPHCLASARWLMLATFILVAACGGGGGSDSSPAPNPYWVQIGSPSSYEIEASGLDELAGLAFVPAGSSCQCIGWECLATGFAGRLPAGYSVTWLNETTGSTGTAYPRLNCLVVVTLSWRAWGVDLAPGVNVIRVTATDVNGNSGTDVVEVTRLPDRTPPQVVAVMPADGSANVPVTTSVYVRFDEAVRDVGSNSFYLMDPDGNLVSSSVDVGESSAAWVLTPDSPLSNSTYYRFVITTAVSDENYNHLSATILYGFTTAAAPDTAAPTIVAVTPRNGTGCTGVDSPIVITFSERINPETFHFSLVGPDGGHHNWGMTFSSTDWNEAVIQVNSGGLVPGMAYTGTVYAGLEDFSGNAMEMPFSWTFGTSQDGMDHCI